MFVMCVLFKLLCAVLRRITDALLGPWSDKNVCDKRHYSTSQTNINKMETGGIISAVQVECDVGNVDSPTPGMMCGA